MLLANLKTITNDVTPTLPYPRFTILNSPCTKIYSHTQLYNAAASSSSHPCEGEVLVGNNFSSYGLYGSTPTNNQNINL